jgi:DNA invertase Pin-like site-specific DNA recombinase
LAANSLIGYARVSTYGQTLDGQLEQLRAADCRKIYREKVTGAHSDRRELLKMLKALVPGDVVMVTRIDRLARSTFDLFAIVKQIVDAKAQFRSLAEPWADTCTSTGRLMIAVLGGLADVERDLIRTRTAEGLSRAQKRGQHMGRPSKLTDAQKAEARRRRAKGRRSRSHRRPSRPGNRRTPTLALAAHPTQPRSRINWRPHRALTGYRSAVLSKRSRAHLKIARLASPCAALYSSGRVSVARITARASWIFPGGTPRSHLGFGKKHQWMQNFH